MKTQAIGQKTRTYLALLAIVIISSIIYSNIFDAPFVFDDLKQIEEKSTIRDLNNYLSTDILFSRRPFAEFTFAMNYEFGQLNVFGYHLVNLVIHIINGFLVYFLTLIIVRATSLRDSLSNPQAATATEQSRMQWASLFSALIFVTHPLQTQAVTYTIQRHASLAAMFYLSSILFYIKGRMAIRHGKPKPQDHATRAVPMECLAYFSLSLICAGLAFFSKENTVSLPGAILLVELVLFKSIWGDWKKRLMWLLPAMMFFVLFVLYFLGFFRGELDFGTLLEDVSRYTKETGKVGRWTYLCTQFNVVSIYIRMLFFPYGQNLDHMYPFKHGFFDGLTPWAFLFLMAIGVTALWNVKKRPIIFFSIFWFFITLSVESSIIPIRDAFFEHRLYLPMLGFAIFLAYLIFYMVPLQRWWPMVIAGLLVVTFGGEAYLRNQVYHDSLTLWNDVTSKSPHNYRAHFNLGNALRDRGRLGEAIIHYSKALSLRPNFRVARDNLGVVLIEKGRLDEAVELFLKAIKTRPRDAGLHCNLGIALMRQGKLNEAINHFSRAIKIKPGYTKAHNNLGIALARQGHMEKAVHHFSKALRIQPNNPETHNNMGLALMLQGNIRDSIQHFSEAIRLNPGDAQAHYRWGIALMRLGDYSGAIEHFSEDIGVSPELNGPQEGLKNALRLQKRKKFQTWNQDRFGIRK